MLPVWLSKYKNIVYKSGHSWNKKPTPTIQNLDKLGWYSNLNFKISKTGKNKIKFSEPITEAMIRTAPTYK